LTFTANATDPDGDSLVLSAAGLPANAGFVDSTNGAGNLLFTPTLTQGGIYSITVTASDGALADSQVVWIRVMPVNQAPVLAAIDSQWVAEGDTLSLNVTATDFDPDSLGLGALGLPANASFTDLKFGNGNFFFTPDYAQAGTYVVTITASDGALADSQAVVVTVSDVNRPPAFAAIDSQSVAEGDTLAFDVSASDDDGDSLVLSAEDLPANATFTDSANGAGRFIFLPGYDQAGAYDVTFVVFDGALSDTVVVAISAGGVNLAPAIAAPESLEVDEGANLAFTVTAVDPDGDTLVLGAVNLPAGAAFTDSGNGTGGFTFAPDYEQAGAYTVAFFASDGLHADTITVTITVHDVNRAPAIALPDSLHVDEMDLLAFVVSATDPDGDSLRLIALNLPDGATFVDSGNGAGAFAYTPGFDEAGVSVVDFVVSDGSLADTSAVTITIGNTNRAPFITVPGAQAVEEGDTLSFAVNATDPDGDPLTLGALELPSGAAFVDSGNGSGLFTFAPDFGQSGSYTIDFTASDGSAVDTAAVSIAVGDVNRAPAISTPDSRSVSEADSLALLVTATDADGDELVLSVEGVPANASFEDRGDGTGDFVFRPDYSQSGNYSVVFIVTDGSLHDSGYVTITVLPVNRAPQISAVVTHSIEEGASLSFAVNGSDPDDDAVSLSMADPLANAAFVDSGSGAGGFTFTPDFGQAGIHEVTFRVTDGALTESLTVMIEVTNGNRPPVFAGIEDASVIEGDTLALDIEASDPDGDAVTLTTLTVPSGATFTDLGAGRGYFVYRPDYEQAGEVTVSLVASDGSLSDTLHFGIVVGDANRPPRFAENGNPVDPEVREGATLMLDLFASDPDGSIPAIHAITLPANATFVDEGDGTGVLAFTPDYDQAGEHAMSWVATDGALTDSLTLLVKVFDSNRAPVVEPVDSQVVVEGGRLELRVEAYDPDGGHPSITAGELIENAAFVDSGNGAGLLTFTPGYLQSGSYEVLLIASDSESEESLFVKIVVTEADLPQTFRVIGSHPNPFNATTSFSFVLGVADGGAPIDVALKVYNIRGAEVATLVRESLPPGPHTFVWNGADRTGEPVVSGMYIFVLQAAGKTESRKALLVR
ncbi:MAG: tandem-95 repeat protein, partial [Gemmatimonadetes bacterium]|nr:tandem-95 repeat protein [Gemmatimonadota bacterium]